MQKKGYANISVHLQNPYSVFLCMLFSLNSCESFHNGGYKATGRFCDQFYAPRQGLSLYWLLPSHDPWPPWLEPAPACILLLHLKFDYNFFLNTITLHLFSNSVNILVMVDVVVRMPLVLVTPYRKKWIHSSCLSLSYQGCRRPLLQ